MKLTVNRLMILLALYRGTFQNELSVGTRTSDVKTLRHAGLIERGSESTPAHMVRLSDRGQVLVEAILVAADQLCTSGGVGLVLPESTALAQLSGRGRQIVGEECRARFGTFSPGFEPEQESKPLSIADIDGDKARLSGGTAFVVAEAGLDLKWDEEVEGEERSLSSVRLTRIDSTVHGSEEAATIVATDRAKSDPGSRHLVLKAVAMHEVAVPIKSTRL